MSPCHHPKTTCAETVRLRTGSSVHPPAWLVGAAASPRQHPAPSTQHGPVTHPAKPLQPLNPASPARWDRRGLMAAARRQLQPRQTGAEQARGAMGAAGCSGGRWATRHPPTPRSCHCPPRSWRSPPPPPSCGAAHPGRDPRRGGDGRGGPRREVSALQRDAAAHDAGSGASPFPVPLLTHVCRVPAAASPAMAGCRWAAEPGDAAAAAARLSVTANGARHGERRLTCTEGMSRGLPQSPAAAQGSQPRVKPVCVASPGQAAPSSCPPTRAQAGLPSTHPSQAEHRRWFQGRRLQGAGTARHDPPGSHLASRCRTWCRLSPMPQFPHP